MSECCLSTLSKVQIQLNTGFKVSNIIVACNSWDALVC